MFPAYYYSKRTEKNRPTFFSMKASRPLAAELGNSARQLILILELCNSNDVYDFLMQIPLKLCADKVSEVRWLSFKLVRNHDL